jgi:ESX secretion-associated protein EspL
MTTVDQQLFQLNARSFRGTDEALTVAVTVDGRQRLTGLQIKDGLLRLGAETVAQRINEAILEAQAAATVANGAAQERLFELMDDAAGSLKDVLGPAYAVVPGPMLRAGRVRRSWTYSAGAPAISAASAITPRYRADGSPPSQASTT